jgi:hypothetical protein
MRYSILPRLLRVRGKHLSPASFSVFSLGLLDAPPRVLDSLPQLVVSREGYCQAIGSSQVGSNRIEVIGCGVRVGVGEHFTIEHQQWNFVRFQDLYRCRYLFGTGVFERYKNVNGRRILHP